MIAIERTPAGARASVVAEITTVGDVSALPRPDPHAQVADLRAKERNPGGARLPDREGDFDFDEDLAIAEPRGTPISLEVTG